MTISPFRAIVVVAIGIGIAAGLNADAAQRRGRGAAGERGRGRGPETGALKHEIKDARRRGAVCNDGSAAAFYFRPGKDPNRNKWIVFFQGGGGCFSDAACTARWNDEHNLMTASGLPTRREEGGLLSDDESVNPDFARFNVAVLHYCSSDGYAGDAERHVDGRTLQFRGRRIVDALIDDLSDRSVVGTPTLREATEVLMAGSSAGAAGVHNNLDRLAGRLSWANVKGIADSIWLPDVMPYGPGQMEIRPDTERVLTYVNGQPDESCAAANPAQKAKCFFESFVFPYLTTPMFVYADQRDPLHFATYGITSAASSPDERAWIQQYGRLLRESLGKLPAAFSPSIARHTALANERFHEAVIDGTTLAEAIGRWYFDRPGPLNLIAQPDAPRGGRRGR